MSGIVATITDGDGRDIGRRALDLIRHDDAWTETEAEAAGVWAGGTGPAGSCEAARAEDGSGTLVVVCGRLTGRDQVGREHGAEPVHPASALLRAYSQGGLATLARLEGAFAFVLVDERDGLVTAGTDPSGIFRQHVVRLGGDVLVSTEAKAFAAHPRFRTALDPLAGAELLTFGYLLEGRSLFKDVQATAHGCWVEVRHGIPKMVRHWDFRQEFGKGRSGQSYLTQLGEAARQAVAVGFGGNLGDDVLLPLTGGLDSRLVAAAAPPGSYPTALTFGTPSEPDVVLSSRLAAARGWRHRLEPLRRDYVREEAAATVWVSEGRLNPVGNLTGFLMRRLTGHRAFLSGVGGEVGRHNWKARMLWPDWPLLEAGDAAFEQRLRGSSTSPPWPARRCEVWPGCASGTAWTPQRRNSTESSLTAAAWIPSTALTSSSRCSASASSRCLVWPWRS